MLTARRRWFRRLPAGLLAAAIATGVCACGGQTTASGPTAPARPNGKSGREVFMSAGCASCHTLAAAHANGTVGPNLDQLKPSVAAVIAQVTHGGGGMPSFAGALSKAQIDAVARFVATATRHR